MRAAESFMFSVHVLSTDLYGWELISGRATKLKMKQKKKKDWHILNKLHTFSHLSVILTAQTMSFDSICIFIKSLYSNHCQRTQSHENFSWTTSLSGHFTLSQLGNSLWWREDEAQWFALKERWVFMVTNNSVSFQDSTIWCLNMMLKLQLISRGRTCLGPAVGHFIREGWWPAVITHH